MQFWVCALLAAFASFLSSVVAVPVSTLDTRDVFVPPILTPRKGTIWTTGSIETVTWVTSNRPKQITNTKGRIVFVKNGLLDFGHPLASGFDILLGEYNVTVPLDVEPGQNYQIVLFGDSGNSSDKFSVIGPSEAESDDEDES